jgi:hypothetical protein
MTKSILQTMQTIVEKELLKGASSLQQATYNDQRTLIKSFFSGKEYGLGIVTTRLVVIDSLYSTNAAYSYFSFEEMAEKICALGGEDKARDYFYKVALTGKDEKKLFCEAYGIQKNLSEGSKQMSLLSKYAYYSLIGHGEKYPLGFPIYDSLAKEAYPTVCKMLGIKPKHRLSSLETPEIGEYIECLQQLRESLFGKSIALFNGFQQYDILDAYLWRMGKFESGNFSLLLGRDDYVKFVQKLDLQAKSIGKGKFEEKDPDYKKRMVDKYKGNPCVSKDNKFDFGKAVVMLCLEKKMKPFAGIRNEAYMNELLNHWRIFHEKKILK